MADNFDNYSMKVQARVDLPSNKDIDAQIRKLEKSISKLKVSGQFDDTALRNLTNQLNTLKANITTANFSPTALTELTNQVNRALQNINIGNINVGNVNNQAQQVGQQIGQQINQGVSQSLSGNTGVLDTFRRSLRNIGMGSEEIDAVANRIENLGVKIEALNQSTSHTVGRRGNRDILSVDISGTDRLGQAIKLTEQYNMATGDLIRSMDSVSTAQQKAGSSTNTFAKQQSQAVTNLTNQINQLNRVANDQNKARPITDSTHLDRLSTAYNEIISAIQRMGNASSDTFVTEQNNVKTLISNYKSLVSEFRNAENVSTKMKGTDFASGLAIARNDLEKFKADAKDFPQIIQTINNLDTAISSVGDASSLNKFNDDLRVARSELAKIKSETSATNRNEKVGINVSGLQSQIADLQRISPEIDKFEANINGAKVTVQSLLTDLANVNTQSDFSVINSKWKAFTDSAKSAGIAITEVATKSDSLTEKVNKIQHSWSDGSYEAKYDSLIAKTRQWVDANDESVISTQKLTTAYNEFNQAASNFAKDGTVANRQKLIDAEEELGRQLKATTNDIKVQNAEWAKSSKVDSLHQKIQEFYDKNTATHRTWGSQLKNMLNETAHGAQVTATRVNEIEQEFLGVSNAARQAGKLGQSFFGSIKEQASKFVQWFSVTSVIMEGVQTLRKMKDAVYDIDTAMTNLYKVTDETDTKYNKFLNSACDNAQRLGRSVSSLIEQTANWAKLGYDIDEASKLAETSSIYANVGEVDDATAVSDIVTAIKSFNIEAGNSIEVVDKLNNLGNKYATSSADLGEGLSKSASALALAGNDINKTLAMLTGGTEITQNASEMGNALKVLSMRIRGMKGELEELGEEYENVESISKIQTQILNQTKGAVNIFDDAGNFRATYDILKDIAEVWDKISQVDQAALLETIAGKQRGNQIAALIQSFQSGQAQKAYADAINSSGSAMQEQERWMQSLEAKTQQFEAAFQSLSNTVLDSDLLKFFVDLGTTGVKAIDGLVSALTPLGTIGVISGGILGAKNAGREKCYPSYHICL